MVEASAVRTLFDKMGVRFVQTEGAEGRAKDKDIKSFLDFAARTLDEDLVAEVTALQHPFVQKFFSRIIELMDIGRMVGMDDDQMVLVMRFVCNMRETGVEYEKRMRGEISEDY